MPHLYYRQHTYKRKYRHHTHWSGNNSNNTSFLDPFKMSYSVNPKGNYTTKQSKTITLEVFIMTKQMRLKGVVVYKGSMQVFNKKKKKPITG